MFSKKTTHSSKNGGVPPRKSRRGGGTCTPETSARRDPPLHSPSGEPWSPGAAWAEAECLPLNPDLVKSTRVYLAVAQAASAFPGLSSPGFTLSRAVSRYLHCWLPLLRSSRERGRGGSAQSDEDGDVGGRQRGEETGDTPHVLVPPLDVLWVWVCHRLNPLDYARHCQHLFGTLLPCPPALLDPSSFTSPQLDADVAHSQQLWASWFPEEPFHLDLCHAAVPGSSEQSGVGPTGGVEDGGIQMAVEAAVVRQGSFWFHVDRPHFKTRHFLEAAVRRYRGFLLLMRETQRLRLGTFCVPLYDIDAVWHAHQLCPESYASDCAAIFGRTQDHDDKDLDKGPQSKLGVGSKATARLWEALFGTPYARAGCSSRGAVPEPATPPACMVEEVREQVEGWGKDLGTLALLQHALAGHDPAFTAQERWAAAKQKFQRPMVLSERSEREVLEVLVTVKSVRGVAVGYEDSFGGKLPLRLALKARKGMDTVLLESDEIPRDKEPVVPLDMTFHSHMALATEGIDVVLLNGRKERNVVGVAIFTWDSILATPGLALDGTYRLYAGGGGAQTAAARRKAGQDGAWVSLSVSVTLPEYGNSLLAFLPSPAVDSFGELPLYRSSPAESGEYRRTRTVVDHMGRDRFVLKLHKGQLKSAVEAKLKCEDPAAAWREISLFEGSWLKSNTCWRMPSAALGLARETGHGANPSVHNWDIRCGIGAMSLTAALANHNAIVLTLRDLNAPHGRPPVALLPGQVMEFQPPRMVAPVPEPKTVTGLFSHKVKYQCPEGTSGQVKSKPTGESYATLVRYPGEAGLRGRATALINFQTGVVEVKPGEEDVAEVLMICAALGVSMPMLLALAPGGAKKTEEVRQFIKWSGLLKGMTAVEKQVTVHQWGATDTSPWYATPNGDWFRGGHLRPPLVLLYWPLVASCGSGVCSSYPGGVCGAQQEIGTTVCGGCETV